MVLPDGSTMKVDTTNFLAFCLEVTAARARRTAAMRVSHDGALDQLEGILPVVEDWHARLNVQHYVYDYNVYLCG